MNFGVDTNVLIRSIVRDDEAQAVVADDLLKKATTLAIPLSYLCEFAWVLGKGYKFAGADIARAIRALLNIPSVATNRPAVEAGLAMLEAGGDFADGVIAYEGLWLGGTTFVSFDRRAVSLLKAQGQSATLLS